MNATRSEKEFIDRAKEQRNRGRRLANVPAHRGRHKTSALCAAPTTVVSSNSQPSVGECMTKIAARIDVGFGNALFIRGEGAGLSWSKGQPLECVESSTWLWSKRHCDQPVTYKLLINDQLWCRGENLTAAPGSQAEVVPLF